MLRDERPCQLLLADVHDPLPPLPGGPGGGVRLVDHEYERGGTCDVHVAWARRTTRRRRRSGWCWTTSSHPYGGGLLRGLPPEQARSLARRIEFVYTPVHGWWLNIAEIEISALVRQCLGKRRLADEGKLGREVEVWAEERNRLGSSVDWRFTTEEARTKLRSLYPTEKQ